MEGLTSSAGNYISDTLSHLFINIISIVVIFILARMVLVLIVNIANKISKLPILNTVNKTSGLFLGVIKGVLIIFIIFTILTPFIIISPEGTIASQTYHSTLGEFFYSNNIIIGFLKERGFLKI
nr:CvpA family protein [Sporosalibacterium faouarense]